MESPWTVLGGNHHLKLFFLQTKNSAIPVFTKKEINIAIDQK